MDSLATNNNIPSENQPYLEKITTHWLGISVVILGLFKLWLVDAQTLTAFHAPHDDTLFLDHAKNILRGDWLGPYDNMTLMKGSFYPIWIALIFLTGIPLMLAQNILYIFSCYIFMLAMSKIVINPRFQLLIFTIMLFNPYTIVWVTFNRVIRAGVYLSLTILVVSCAFAILFRYRENLKSLLPWAIGLGISVSMFWQTREEGIILGPLFILVFGLATYRVWQYRPEDMQKRLGIILCIPFGIWLFSYVSVATLNKIYYGSFAVNEMKAIEFRSALGALYRIKPPNGRDPKFSLPQSVRDIAYTVSPSFLEAQIFLDNSGWSIQGWGKKGEVATPWVLFAFRDAVAALGYFDSPRKANEYFMRVANEVNSACEEKKIKCLGQRTSPLPPVDNFIPLMLDAIKYGINNVWNFSGVGAGPQEGAKDRNTQNLFLDMTNERLTTTSSYLKLQISGWAFGINNPINISVRNEQGEFVDYKLEMAKAIDVHKYFINKGINYPNAKESRFTILTSCLKACYLYFKSGDRLIARHKLDASTSPVKAGDPPEIFYNIDFFGEVGGGQQQTPGQNALSKVKISILEGIITFFKFVFSKLAILILIMYCYLTLEMIKKRKIGIRWLFLSCCLGTVFGKIFLLALLSVTTTQSHIHILYMSSVGTIYLMFLAMGTLWLFSVSQNFIARIIP